MHKGYVAIGCVHTGFICIFSVLFALVQVESAYAYVDPSIMTYTIQALAGVAVALSAVLGVAWRRVSKAVYRKFNIDENAGKVVEEDVHAVSSSDPRASEILNAADQKTKAEMALIGSRKPQNIRWLPRFLLALLASIFMVYTIGVVAPLEMVANSYESLVFGVSNVWSPLVIFGAILSVGVALATSFIRGRAFNVAVGCMAALGLCFYIQGTFMNSGLPVADGTVVNWGDFTTITCLTTVVWIGIFAVFVYLALKRGSTLKSASSIICIVLVIVQSVGLMSLFSNPNSSEDGFDSMSGRPFITQEGLLELSDQDNVIVFVLDMFDNDYLDEVLVDDPDALEAFTGFTWYQNSSGSMIPTRYAVASMLTGRTLENSDEAFSNSLIRSWYREDNMLDVIHEQGFESDIFTTDVNNGIVPLVEKADNVKKVDFVASIPTAVAELWKCSLYRDMPWLLKAPFWFYTGDLNAQIALEASHGDVNSTPYVMDDVEFYDSLSSDKLSVVSEKDKKGAFKFIHLAGPHFPITMNEKAQRVSEGQTSMIKQAEGSLLIVSEYLEQMKQLGIYDKATIVITADHGRWYLADEISDPSSPILLVKPPESPEEASQSLKVSNAPVSHHDLTSTILAAVGADPAAFGSGLTVFDVPDEPRTRYYDATAVVNGHDYVAIKEWAINGDVQDWGSWSKTGQEWPIISD